MLPNLADKNNLGRERRFGTVSFPAEPRAQVNEQEQHAITNYAYHLAGMGIESGTHSLFVASFWGEIPSGIPSIHALNLSTFCPS